MEKCILVCGSQITLDCSFWMCLDLLLGDLDNADYKKLVEFTNRQSDGFSITNEANILATLDQPEKIEKDTPSPRAKSDRLVIESIFLLTLR